MLFEALSKIYQAMSSPLGMTKGWQELGERWLRGIAGQVE